MKKLFVSAGIAILLLFQPGCKKSNPNGANSVVSSAFFNNTSWTGSFQKVTGGFDQFINAPIGINLKYTGGKNIANVTWEGVAYGNGTWSMTDAVSITNNTEITITFDTANSSSGPYSYGFIYYNMKLKPLTLKAWGGDAVQDTLILENTPLEDVGNILGSSEIVTR